MSQPQNLLTAWPLVGPTSITPGPVPTQMLIAEARNGAERAIVLQVITPGGVSTHFLDPDAATAIGKRLLELGGAGISIVPANGIPRIG